MREGFARRARARGSVFGKLTLGRVLELDGICHGDEDGTSSTSSSSSSTCVQVYISTTAAAASASSVVVAIAIVASSSSSSPAAATAATATASPGLVSLMGWDVSTHVYCRAWCPPPLGVDRRPPDGEKIRRIFLAPRAWPCFYFILGYCQYWQKKVKKCLLEK